MKATKSSSNNPQQRTFCDSTPSTHPRRARHASSRQSAPAGAAEVVDATPTTPSPAPGDGVKAVDEPVKDSQGGSSVALVRMDHGAEPFANLPLSERLDIRKQLEACEKTINQFRDGWQVVVKAYNQIRGLRLYRAEGYNDFETYCRERLKLGKSTVNRQIAAGEIYTVLASTEAKILPTSERQIRALLSLRKAELAPEVWAGNVTKVWAKAVQDSELNRSPITEKRVAAARKQLGFEAEQKEEKKPETDLDTRWLKLEAMLRHEREFWPVDRRHELSVRIAGLLAEWHPSAKKGHPEFDDASANPTAATKTEPEPKMDPDDPEEKPRVVAGPMPEVEQ